MTASSTTSAGGANNGLSDKETDVLDRVPTGPRQDVHGDPDDQPGEDLARHMTEESHVVAKLSLTRESIFVATVCCAQLVTQIGLGQCLNITEDIGRTFGITSAGQQSWLIAAYSLTVGSFILVSGRLGDIFGYKRMIIIGYIWYSFWSLIAGLSVYSNSVLFLFCRAFQGIGPSILLPNGIAVFGRAYPPGQRKNMVFAIFGACAPSGGTIGTIFSAIFVTYASWPWTFYSFAIALALVAVIAAWAIPSSPQPSRNMGFKELMGELDILGGTVGVAALVLINVAWNQAPIEGWNTPYIYVLLIIGCLLAAVFFWIELSFASHPLLPVKALNSSVSFVLACIACGWGMFGIWAYYIWQIYIRIRQLPLLLACAWFCPVVVSGALAAVCSGYLLHRIGPAWVMFCAMSAFVIGGALLVTTPGYEGQIYWKQLFLCTVIMPWGMDASFPAATIILSDSVPRKHQGIGASLVNTVLNYSISLALGFAGTAEAYTNHGGATPEDVLLGIRVAVYVGIGLAGLGWLISLVFLAQVYFRKPKAASDRVEKAEKVAS